MKLLFSRHFILALLWQESLNSDGSTNINKTYNLLWYQIIERKKDSTCDFGYRVQQNENNRHQMGNQKPDWRTINTMANRKSTKYLQKNNDRATRTHLNRGYLMWPERVGSSCFCLNYNIIGIHFIYKYNKSRCHQMKSHQYCWQSLIVKYKARKVSDHVFVCLVFRFCLVLRFGYFILGLFRHCGILGFFILSL